MAFSDYGSVRFWYDAAQESFAEGAGVSQWTDRSGAGRHMLGDGGGYPLMQRTAFNGGPGILFDNTLNRRFDVTGAAGFYPASFTMLLAVKFATATPPGGVDKYLWDCDVVGNLSRHYCRWLSTGALQAGTDGGGGSLALPTGTVKAGQPCVVSVTYNGAASELRFNAFTVYVDSVISTNASGTSAFVGSSYASAGAGVLHMAEMVCYNAALSPTDHIRAAQEMMNRNRIGLRSTPIVGASQVRRGM